MHGRGATSCRESGEVHGGGASCRKESGEAHAWHLFVVRLTDEARTTRDDLIEALARRGVGCSVHYVPLHRQPYWRDRYALRSEQFPQADAAWQRMVSIPLFSAMSDEEQGRVIAALRAELG